METFAFFPSENKDRVVSSSQFAGFLSQFFTTGVFNNGLKVEKGDGMSIIIKSGYALINGYFYHNDSDLRISISSPHESLNRIDNIVIRLSHTDRSIHAFVVNGVPNSNAYAPALTRTIDTYEIRLATITVEKGTNSIDTSMITDCRFDDNDCGIVMGAVEQIDTTEVFNQYKEYFNNWFKNLKNQLDSNQAGNLQHEIEDINTQLEPYEDKLIKYDTCTNEELQEAINNSD